MAWHCKGERTGIQELHHVCCSLGWRCVAQHTLLFLRVVNTAKEAEYILIRLGNGFIATGHLALGRDLFGITFASFHFIATFGEFCQPFPCGFISNGI